MVLFPRLEFDPVPDLGGVEMVREVLQKFRFRPDGGVADSRVIIRFLSKIRSRSTMCGFEIWFMDLFKT